MDLGISQRELARRLGVSKSTIENWEGNETAPDRRLMPRMNDFLGYQLQERAESIGRRLAAYRRAAGLTRREFAERLGVHPVTLLRWEKGQRHPRESLCGRLDAFLADPANNSRS